MLPFLPRRNPSAAPSSAASAASAAGLEAGRADPKAALAHAARAQSPARKALTAEEVRTEQLDLHRTPSAAQLGGAAPLQFAPSVVLASSLRKLDVVSGFQRAKRVVAALREVGIVSNVDSLRVDGIGPEALFELLSGAKAMKGIALNRRECERIGQYLSMMASNLHRLGDDISIFPQAARPIFFKYAWPQQVSLEHSQMLTAHLQRAGVLDAALLPVNAAPLAGELGQDLAELFPDIRHLAAKLEAKLFATLPAYAPSNLPAYKLPEH